MQGYGEPGKVTHGELFPRSQTFAKLQGRSLYQKEKESSSEVNAKFDAEKSPNRRQRDVVARAKLRDEMDDEFLNQVCAVGDAGDEGRAWNRNSTQWQPRTQRANKKRGHAETKKRELPNGRRDRDVIAFAQV